MSVAARTATFKLFSTRGTLLGTVTIPRRWIDLLQENRSVQFALQPPPSLTFDPHETVSFKVGMVSEWYGEPNAVCLSGVSLEEFERLEDCSFAPGAAYLRSLIGGC